MASLKFAHLALTCREPLKVERFYTKYFGFRRARVVPTEGSQVVFLKAGDVYLELFEAQQPAPVAPANGAGGWAPGWRHIAFTVDDVDAKLAELGTDARVTLGPLRFDDVIPGWYSVWVADPEGNIIELSQGYVDEQELPPVPDA